MLYVCNVLESEIVVGNHHSRKVTLIAKERGADSVIISSKIEEAISILEHEQEKQEFLETFNLEETCLSQVIKAA